MPMSDGLEATARIRAFEDARGLGPCFISALTANASDENKADCLRSGMDWYCTKPVSADAVREVLQRCQSWNRHRHHQHHPKKALLSPAAEEGGEAVASLTGAGGKEAGPASLGGQHFNT